MNTMEENYELAKWLAGEMTESELIAFQKTPEFVVYTKIANYSSKLEVPSFDEIRMHKNVIDTKKQPKSIPLFNTKWIRIAAVLLVFLGLAFFAKTQLYYTVLAKNGQQSTFILPDNSEVVLNSGSEMEYKNWNWDNNRELNLKGEAYFKVAKGKTFEVVTALGKVTVIGTQFNVKARKNRFEVTCYQGKVKVNHNNKTILLTKGKSIIFGIGNQFEMKEINVTEPQWRNGELVFDKESLETILDELKRQYNLEFVLKNHSSEQLFTGVIPMKNLDAALEILSFTYHLQVKKVSTKTIVLESLNVQK
jgi:ferric-dicitrate binding protein FerR (iron transport regulator)